MGSTLDRHDDVDDVDDVDGVDGVDGVDDRPPSLRTTIVERLRFVGPGRVLGAAGAVLVLAGVAWWLLRAPAMPTEARLPRAGPATAVAAQSGAQAGTLAVTTTATSTTVAVALVHVTGAVSAPGVYALEPGQRVIDAITAAGGPAPDADPDALNLAAPIADGDRIAVPSVGETVDGSGSALHSHSGAEAGSVPGDPIDINTASAAELETLPGIGPTTAAAIVEHRTQHGPYASVDDLEAVRGIGPAKLETIRDRVTV